MYPFFAHFLLQLVGEKFGPNVNESETLYVFIDLLARSVPLVKIGEFEEKGITLWKYEVAKNLTDCI